MPPVPEQRNPAPPSIAALAATTPSTTLKAVRIFLLILILIGVGLIATEKLWVPNIVDVILGNQSSLTSPDASDTGLSAWASLVATSTEYGYSQQNGEITFRGRINQSNIIGQAGALEGVSVPADSNSFVVSNVDPSFAKDAAHVFYTGVALPKADPHSFIVLSHGSAGGSYAKDTEYAYFEINSSDASGSLTPIPDADAASFSAIGYGYAKDVHSAYLDGKVIPVADPTTFKFVGFVGDTGTTCDGVYTKDKNNVYFCGDSVSGADPSTFSILMDSNGATSTYAKDGRFVYESSGGSIYTLTGADPNTFAVLYDGYAKDKSKVYGIGDASLDPQTFSIIPGTHSGEYVRDTNHILYNTGCLDSAGSDCSDGNIHGVDLPTFVVLNDLYGKDTHHVYYGSDPISGADAESFHIFTPPKEAYASGENILVNQQWYFAADKNFVYFAGKVLAGADAATFHLDVPSGNFCQEDCASDKNHIYDMDGSISD